MTSQVLAHYWLASEMIEYSTCIFRKRKPTMVPTIYKTWSNLRKELHSTPLSDSLKTWVSQTLTSKKPELLMPCTNMSARDLHVLRMVFELSKALLKARVDRKETKMENLSSVIKMLLTIMNQVVALMKS